MRGIPTASLVIGIASSPDERRQLAQLLAGTAAFLIVSSVSQAREFLGVPQPTRTTASPPSAAAGAVLASTGAAVTVAAITEPVENVPPPPPAGLSVDSDRRMLRWLDREIELTPLEHDFLRCLVGSPGQVWTYERLHLKVWGNVHLGRGSDMHSVVRRVRRKLAWLNATTTIHAVRGVGFRLATS